MIDFEITDNEFLRQFELQVGDNMARIEYSLQERKIFLTKFEMCSDMEDQGFAEPFLEAVFKEIKGRNISMMPTSPRIASYVRSHRRKYKEMLPVGINI